MITFSIITRQIIHFWEVSIAIVTLVHYLLTTVYTLSKKQSGTKRKHLCTYC